MVVSKAPAAKRAAPATALAWCAMAIPLRSPRLHKSANLGQELDPKRSRQHSKTLRTQAVLNSSEGHLQPFWNAQTQSSFAPASFAAAQRQRPQRRPSCLVDGRRKCCAMLIADACLMQWLLLLSSPAARQGSFCLGPRGVRRSVAMHR